MWSLTPRRCRRRSRHSPRRPRWPPARAARRSGRCATASRAARPIAVPIRIATIAPNRSATMPQARNDDRRRGRRQDADDADVGQRQVEPVDVDQRVERQRGDEAAAVEPLGERDTSEHRALAEGADGVTGGEARQVARGLGAKARCTRRHTRPRSRPADRDGRGPTDPVGEETASEGGRAPAAARPVPMHPDDPATQARRVHRAPQAQMERAAERQADPEDDRGEDHHERRRDDEEGDSDAAPAPRMRASWRGERGPKRPAKTPRRLAMKGAAASAARPSGSRPPRRAIVGRRVVTGPCSPRHRRQPSRSSARLRPSARYSARVRDDRCTTYLEAARLACEVSCRARRGFAAAVVRDSPRYVGPPSSVEEVRPRPTIAAMRRSSVWADGPGGRCVRRRRRPRARPRRRRRTGR